MKEKPKIEEAPPVKEQILYKSGPAGVLTA
jgi:hypothetical protein